MNDEYLPCEQGEESSRLSLKHNDYRKKTAGLVIENTQFISHCNPELWHIYCSTVLVKEMLENDEASIESSMK